MDADVCIAVLGPTEQEAPPSAPGLHISVTPQHVVSPDPVPPGSADFLALELPPPPDCTQFIRANHHQSRVSLILPGGSPLEARELYDVTAPHVVPTPGIPRVTSEAEIHPSGDLDPGAPDTVIGALQELLDHVQAVVKAAGATRAASPAQQQQQQQQQLGGDLLGALLGGGLQRSLSCASPVISEGSDLSAVSGSPPVSPSGSMHSFGLAGSGCLSPTRRKAQRRRSSFGLRRSHSSFHIQLPVSVLTGFKTRMGEGGFDNSGYRLGAGNVQDFEASMREDTMHREDYPLPGEEVMLFDWVRDLAGKFVIEFDEQEATVLGRLYDPAISRPRQLEIRHDDIIQPAKDRMSDGSCSPRTAIAHCGLHAGSDLHYCAKNAICIAHPGTSGGATCLLDNFSRVAGRVLRALRKQPPLHKSHAVDSATLRKLAAAGSEAVSEGVLAVHVYSYELKSRPGESDGTPDNSRYTQIYRVVTTALRHCGDPNAQQRLSSEELDVVQRVLVLFRPFTWRLDQFVLLLPHHQNKMVFRGVRARVADDFGADAFVLWPAFSSTSASRDIAWSFLSEEAAGTYWAIQANTAADISPFSWLPAEEEFLLPSRCIFKVVSKATGGVQAILNTNHDVIIVVQVDHRSAECGTVDTDSRFVALEAFSMLFENFVENYIEPQVLIGAEHAVADSRRVAYLSQNDPKWFLDEFSTFARGVCQTALLLGEVGFGKTAAALRILRAAIDLPSPLPGRRWLPLYVSCPEVRDLFGTGHEAPLLDHIARQYHLSKEAVDDLRSQPVLLVLDSFEDVYDGQYRLRKSRRTLLEVCGIDLNRWPHLRVVVCLRPEVFVGRGRLKMQQVHREGPIWRIAALSEVRTDEAVEKRLKSALANVVMQLMPEDAPAVDTVLRTMDCWTPAEALVVELRDAARRAEKRDGMLAREAAKWAVTQPQGDACIVDMVEGTRSIIRAVDSADPQLLSSPFMLSVAIRTAQRLDPHTVRASPVKLILGTFARDEVERRLPLLDKLKEKHPAWSLMSKDERTSAVLEFSSALAASEALLAVHSSMALVSSVRRSGRINVLDTLDLGTPKELVREMLKGSLVQLDCAAGTFRFASANLHDHFLSEYIARLMSSGADWEADATAQRCAMISNVFVQGVIEGHLDKDGLERWRALRRRISSTRWAARMAWAVLVAFGALAFFSARNRGLASATIALAAFPLIEICPKGARETVRVCVFIAGIAFIVAWGVREYLLCSHWEDWRNDCGIQRSLTLVWHIGVLIPLQVMIFYFRFLFAAWAAVRVWQWPSAAARNVFLIALSISIPCLIGMIVFGFTQGVVYGPVLMVFLVLLKLSAVYGVIRYVRSPS